MLKIIWFSLNKIIINSGSPHKFQNPITKFKDKKKIKKKKLNRNNQKKISKKCYNSKKNINEKKIGKNRNIPLYFKSNKKTKLFIIH